MAFPDDPLEITTELQLAGVWTDVSQYVYTREPITITAGRADEGQRVEPSRCSLTLNNRDGRFSGRNPMSPYYGQLGRNTPLRVSVKGPEPYLNLDGHIDGYVSTPDAAALDIVGDLDIRAETSIAWYAASLNQVLIAKWDGATGQRSYALRILDGVLWLNWSVDGAAPTAAASWDLPALPARAALRATLDVDNGAGGRTVRMYWATSLDGPWTQFSDDIIQAGTTSIFAGTAPLRVGSPDTSTATPRVPFTGRGHRFEVRNGIAGPVVASPNFTTQTPGALSFVDGTGKTWTLNGSAELTNREIRFTGEVSAWPPRWDVSGNDVWTPIEAAGVLRRLGQGNKPLDSTLRRAVPSFSPLAYWPMEEGQDAVQAYSPIAGVSPLRLSRATWASADSLASSLPLPVLASSSGDLPKLSGTVPAPAGVTTGWQVRWVYRLDSLPTTLWTFMRILCTGGTIAEWYVQSRDTSSRIIGYDSDGVEVINHLIGTGADLFNQWVSVDLHASESGGTVSWEIIWQDVGGDAGAFNSSYAGTVGRVQEVSGPPAGYATALDGMALGHIAVFPTTSSPAYDGAITAYAGESALERLARLNGEEERLNLSWIDGDPGSESELMGPQRPAALRELLQDCADADGGILYENREALALVYRTRTSLYNQEAALTLDYEADGEVAPPLEPAEDDQRIRNDVTVTRSGGSSGRVVIDEGPLSVLAPEDGGVGIYDETVTLKIHADAQTRPIAGWRAHLGTWDEARYPSVHVMLHAAPHLINDVLRLRIGDRGVIRNPPAWLPPDDIKFLTHGYTEVLDLYTWDVFFNAAPAGPWEVGVRDDTARGRRDTSTSTLAANVDSTATSLSVASGWVEDFEDDDHVTAVSGTWARTDSEAHSGSWSFRSAVIGNNATSDAVVAVPPGARTVQFWYRVSSEAGFDFFRFYIDGVEQASASGEGVWTQSAVYDVTGASELTFRYVKDANTIAGSDAAFIDDLSFVAGPLWTTAPGDVPFDVLVGGERVTVTAISGTASPQTFTAVRSVNGISKAHAAGTDLRLVRPTTRAL